MTYPRNDPKLLWLVVAIFLSGLLAGAAAAVWLAATEISDIHFLVAWHGRLMVFAWAMLSPFVILAARFFKVLPWQNWPHELDNPAWWHAHRLGHYLTGVVAICALALILSAPFDPSRTYMTHKLIGYGVFALASVQFVTGWLRGTKGGPTAPAADGSLFGDHYNMTPRRRAFELTHKINGYATIVLAMLAVMTGLYAARAPDWMWIGIAFWWGTLGALAMLLHLKWRITDTYQAIWGIEPIHPNNRPEANQDVSSAR